MLADSGKFLVGHVASLFRYPVKSMGGESLRGVSIGENGLAGDRQFAVIDVNTGLVASAKKPAKWGKLTAIAARLTDGELILTFEDGTSIRPDRENADLALSRLLGIEVTIRASGNSAGAIEMEWPDLADPNGVGASTREELRPGGFFDLAPIHLLTSATLDRFETLHPQSRFSYTRFRPNIVVKTISDLQGFVENDWTGRSLQIGEVRLAVTARCSRCVMTTIRQGTQAADPSVLRAIAQQNSGTLGAYATPTRTGEISEGDPVWLM